MDNNSKLDPFVSPKPQQVTPLGGMIGGFDDFETESSHNSQSNNSNLLTNAFLSAPADFLTPIGKVGGDLAKDSADAILDLGKEIFSGFTSKGSIDNFQKPNPEQAQKQQEAQIKRNFYAQMEDSRRNVRSLNTQQAMENAARFEVASMSVGEKLDALHLNMDLDEKHINDPYHINELRRKKLEQLKEAKRQQESQQLAEVTKGKSLLLNQNAQEGQSMTSTSGAIVSAG